MSDQELATEIGWFNAHRSELLTKAPGKFALIKGEELINTFDTDQNAYEEGVRKFGLEPFLIKEIAPEDRVEFVPAYSLGLLHAHF